MSIELFACYYLPLINYVIFYSFVLADTFGDGWNTANFFYYDSYGNYAKKTSYCEDNVVVDKYCFNPQTSRVGDTVNATVFGFKPDNAWEVNDLIV